MNEDELELAILTKYVTQFEHIGENNQNKCARELDMREVLKELVGTDSQAKLWHNRLAPRSSGKAKGVLRPCSDSTVLNTSHKYHARAFTDVINDQPSPAWDRIRELKEKLDLRKTHEAQIKNESTNTETINEIKNIISSVSWHNKPLGKLVIGILIVVLAACVIWAINRYTNVGL